MTVLHLVASSIWNMWNSLYYWATINTNHDWTKMWIIKILSHVLLTSLFSGHACAKRRSTYISHGWLVSIMSKNKHCKHLNWCNNTVNLLGSGKTVSRKILLILLVESREYRPTKERERGRREKRLTQKI